MISESRKSASPNCRLFLSVSHILNRYSSSQVDWREKYQEVADMLADTKAELDEVHTFSKELEEELEKEMDRTEKAQQNLRVKIEKTENDRDEWKVSILGHNIACLVG